MSMYGKVQCNSIVVGQAEATGEALFSHERSARSSTSSNRNAPGSDGDRTFGGVGNAGATAPSNYDSRVNTVEDIHHERLAVGLYPYVLSEGHQR